MTNLYIKKNNKFIKLISLKEKAKQLNITPNALRVRLQREKMNNHNKHNSEKLILVEKGIYFIEKDAQKN